ncbi:MAG: type 1 glutamine amidotransferase domain-containing protein [Bacteroidales bacterium]|nr:type 1 glutamine amidotransferase domain-containing protein [Bacteroidales bacterium]
MKKLVFVLIAMAGSIFALQSHAQETEDKILMVITSHGTLGENKGEPTGYYLSEVSHAYYVFTEAGYEVDFVSPKGGKSPVDGYNLEDEDNKRFVNDETAQRKINNAMKPSEVDESEYAAVYYAGGHGTMWDLPDNEALASITAQSYESGGVVGAVCHGPAGLVNVKLSDGSYLVEGKTVSAFTNEEEVASGKDKYVPFMLETKLKNRGAKHVESDNWQKKVVADGRLVTGQTRPALKGWQKTSSEY